MNTCFNRGVFSHSDPAMIKWLYRLMEEEGLSLLDPIPDEIASTPLIFISDEDELMDSLEKQREENRRKYGYEDPLDYARGEWGCCGDPLVDKWIEHPNGQVTVFFRTSSAPMTPVLERLVEMGFSVELECFVEERKGYIMKTVDGKLEVQEIEEPKDEQRQLKSDVFSKEFIEFYC